MRFKKQKRTYFMSLFIIFIMVFSVAGYLWQGAVSDNPEDPTPTTPDYLLNISMDTVTLAELNSAQKIYLSTKEEDIPANFRLPLTPLLNLATYDEQISIDQNLPLKTCEDATPSNKVILFDESSNITEITYNDNCLVLKGNIQQATDKLIYELLSK